MLLQSIPPALPASATTTGTVQPAPGAATGTPPAPKSFLEGIVGNPLVMIVPLGLFLVFSTMRKNKAELAARGSMKKGDKVTSTSGLIGELVELDAKIAKVKLAPGITVQMLASSIAPMVETPAVAAGAEPAKAEKK
jgi:preprotein translocase YajC subunit